jgi:isocitrate/isopropylmalate dehydrogenase
MPLRILVLPDDGIGPEITRATLQVLRSADAAFSLGGITVFEPGAAVARHSHNCDESVMVLASAAATRTIIATSDTKRIDDEYRAICDAPIAGIWSR